ncbi:17944_t:CDS:2, partial [Gigaspora rosea]
QNQQTVQNVIIEAHSNLFDDNYSIPEPEAYLPSDDDYLSDNNFALENEVATHSKHKRKNNKVANKDMNMQKRIHSITAKRRSDKEKRFEHNLDNRQGRAIFNEDESIEVQNLGVPFSTFTSNIEIYNKFTERKNIKSFNYSDSQSDVSNEEYYSDSQSDVSFEC